MAIATELAEASVHGDPVAFLGNVCRTQHALAKACATTSGRPLNIVVLGHSLPGGRHVQRRERWSEQLWGALNASWPARCGRPVVTNLALGGTKIDYIVAAHAGLLEQGLAAADVVLVDYARYQPAGGSDLDVPATEEAGLSEAMLQAQAEAAVLRLLELPRRPALLFALLWASLVWAARLGNRELVSMLIDQVSILVPLVGHSCLLQELASSFTLPSRLAARKC